MNFKNPTATSYVLQYKINADSGYIQADMIDEDAFRGWKHNLSSIEIKSGYSEIAKNAFLDSWKLKTYIIPSSVKTIGKHAIGYEYDEKTGK